MSPFRWSFAPALILALAGACLADCGKVMIVGCPPGMTIEDYLKSLQGNGSLASSLVTPTPPAPVTPPPEEGDETVLPPIDGDEIQTLADGSSRAYFLEPAQRAVIAWNGKQEILVLKTEERSLVGRGAMLSFLPLPGRPLDVRKGDQKLFDKAYNLVYSKLETANAVGVRDKDKDKPLIERTIGAHNIFVWKIEKGEEFAAKIQAYVQKKFARKAVAVFGKDTERVVKEYIADGYIYFAFDLLLETAKDHSEKVAIEYHFESPFVYYPLRDSQSGGGGETRVELVVFTDKAGVNANKGEIKFADKDNKNGDIMTLGKRSVKVTGSELKQLHPGMAKLFGGGEVRGRIWVMEGKLNGFKGDVQAFQVKK